MQATIDIVLPVFGLTLCGWLVGKSPLLSSEGIRGINNFVFYVAIPALLFRSMSTLTVPETLDGAIIVAYFLSCGLVFTAALVLGHKGLALKLDEAAIFGMGGIFGNQVMFGVPLILLAFGEQGLVALLFIISFHPLILITVPTLVIEIARGGGNNAGQILWSALKGLLRHPVILGMLSGLVWRQTGLGLYPPVETLVDMLRDAATPAALFAVGATLTNFRVAGNVRHALLVVAVKLAVMPAVVWTVSALIFRLDPLWTAVATIAAAMPTGVNVYLLASSYDIYVARATTATLISTAASIVTVGVLINLLVP